MEWFLATLAFGVASAIIPVFNIEVYLGAVAASQPVSVWALAIAGASGQMIGKMAYYVVGRTSLDWPWVRRKVEKPSFQAGLARWQQRVERGPVVAAGFVLLSATVGLPPFAIVSVLAGMLRMNWVLFLVVGFVGRTLRFAFILGATAAIFT